MTAGLLVAWLLSGALVLSAVAVLVAGWWERRQRRRMRVPMETAWRLRDGDQEGL